MRDRIASLRWRVTWLDRWRHLLAIGAALAIIAHLLSGTGDIESGWPPLNITILGVMLGSIVWWIAECVLAWIAAMWEARHDELLRDRAFADWPRAIARRRRR